MSNEEVEAGNRLIAEFMGTKIGEDKYSWRPGCVEPLQEHHLAYHKQWGWLMPVVEKIEKEDFGFKMCRKVVEVYCDSTKEIILKTKESCRLDSLYKAVVQFITWYNTHQHGK
jgi:hypothetical protein